MRMRYILASILREAVAAEGDQNQIGGVMEVLKASSFRSFRRQPNEPIPIRNPSNLFKIPCTFPRFTKINPPTQKLDLKTFTATSPVAPWADQASPPPEQEAAVEKKEEKFDWYENWYPVAAVCDLDKRRPHGKKVIGIDLVVWWDRNENAWKVFDDSCPHRLAPLSEGRIDQSGRLQCVYHGWCFGGAGDCKFIPQAPRDGPPVHSWKKACVQGVYPSCVQNEMVWFWPNSDPQYKDIYLNKKPPYIPELGDPSFTNSMMSREIPYGYEVLTENFMDPAHVPYAHYGVLEIEKVGESVKSDREGGREIEFSVGKVDVNGFSAKQLTHANYYFIPPCLYYGRIAPLTTTTTTTKDATIPLVPLEKTIVLIFYCIPVSPGRSRVIFASPRNFAVQIDRILPRWISHIKENLILDSDLFLLHLEERKLKDLDWHKSCYTPTRSDAQIIAFRRWLNKYGGTQVDWRNKFPATLPPTPPREQLMDRYWSHTVICSSCSLAYKRFNALEIGLQVISIASIAVAAASAISIGARYSLASMAVLCFVASKWLSRFIYKTFRYHGYDHAFK